MPPLVGISGFARSGTHLLCSLLDGHPDILALPFQLKLDTKFANLYYRQRSNAVLWLALALERRTGIPYQEFTKVGAGDHPMDVIQGVVEVVNAHARYGRPYLYWATKTHYSNRWLPNRRVFIMRDPRAVYASLKARARRQGHRPMGLYRFCASFDRYLQALLPQFRAGEQGDHMVFYEDLVGNPGRIMAFLLDALGLDWDDAVLTPTRLGKDWNGNSSHRGDSPAVQPYSADAWKQTLANREIAVIEEWLQGQLPYSRHTRTSRMVQAEVRAARWVAEVRTRIARI